MQTTHYHSTGMIDVKQLISEEIKAQTEAFLDKGGKIKVIPSQESTSINPAANSKASLV